EYVIHVIGDEDAKVDYSHIDDFARYLVATLCEPRKSENASLNFRSDHISHREIAALLERYSGKKVRMVHISEEEMHKGVADPKTIPKELSEGSPFRR
ncbi:MAG: NmrA family NAD(P)-binding protein, partial [Janthinobacterium lividum]